MKRYGKSASAILGVNQAFFAENAAYLAKALRHAQIYTAQPARTQCKLCLAELPSQPAFIKHGIPYAFCQRCGHLNGLHEDTDAFCRAVYLDEEYDEYYSSPDPAAYQRRVDGVYAPKVAFLRDALREAGLDPASMSYADLGAGSGYLVAALVQAGLTNSHGYELSPSQVAYANRMLPSQRLNAVALENSIDEMAAVQADVACMIGSLEHLQDPRRMLDGLRRNPRVRYLLLCVPLFSLCVYLEMAFPQVYPRHLVSDHTHLFTPASLEWMAQEFHLERVAEWWFGSDMLDLFRHVRVQLETSPDTAGMGDAWTALMRTLIDPLQLAIDQRQLPSEVHLLFKLRPAGTTA